MLLKEVVMCSCPFCEIVKGNLEASIIYEDELVLAIVPLHSIYPESALIFPKEHIDHFTDLPKKLAMHVMSVGFDLGKKIMGLYEPERVGMLVHGYGVSHAHFNVFPQNHPHDVTSRHFAYLKNGEIRFGLEHFITPSREIMDNVAKTLSNAT